MLALNRSVLESRWMLCITSAASIFIPYGTVWLYVCVCMYVCVCVFVCVCGCMYVCVLQQISCTARFLTRPKNQAWQGTRLQTFAAQILRANMMC